MAKIGIGYPSTIWKGNLMVCTCIIQTKNMMNDMNKSRLIDKPKKRAGTRVQGIVKNKLEIVKVKKTQSVLTDTFCIVK